MFILDIFLKDFDNDGILDIIAINKTTEEEVYVISFHSITDFGIYDNKQLKPIKIQKNHLGLYKIV